MSLILKRSSLYLFLAISVTYSVSQSGEVIRLNFGSKSLTCPLVFPHETNSMLHELGPRPKNQPFVKEKKTIYLEDLSPEIITQAWIRKGKEGIYFPLPRSKSAGPDSLEELVRDYIKFEQSVPPKGPGKSHDPFIIRGRKILAEFDSATENKTNRYKLYLDNNLFLLKALLAKWDWEYDKKLQFLEIINFEGVPLADMNVFSPYMFFKLYAFIRLAEIYNKADSRDKKADRENSQKAIQYLQAAEALINRFNIKPINRQFALEGEFRGLLEIPHSLVARYYLTGAQIYSDIATKETARRFGTPEDEHNGDAKLKELLEMGKVYLSKHLEAKNQFLRQTGQSTSLE